MKALLIFCLLMTVLPSVVTSLKCQTCWGMGEDCQNSTKECDKFSDQSCMYTAGVGKMAFIGSEFAFKSCIDTQLCNDSHSSVTISPSVYIQTKMTCCQTDMCNSGPLERPEPEQMKPNGLKCPSCVSLFSDTCNSTETISCRNAEDQCLHIATRVNLMGPKFPSSLQGCVTAGMCDQLGEMVTVLESMGIEITEAKCTKTEEDDHY